MSTTSAEKITTFKYAAAGDPSEPKTTVRCARTDLVVVAVQIVRDGGETNLHAHSNQDAVWFVLEGRAKFYGEGDVVVADVGDTRV